MERISTEARSKNMSAIRSKGNRTTELAMIKLLRKQGITGWRRNIELFGKPDFIWRAPRVALFLDGCFWHGCPKCRQTPVNNAEYWTAKMIRNKRRDKEVSVVLSSQNWLVIRVWECEVKAQKIDKLLIALEKAEVSVG